MGYSMSKFDETLCKFYDDNFCRNVERPTYHCEGYQCIYKERSLLREHCKFIDETNKILNDAKESLLKENEKLKKQYNCYACGNCNGKEDYINLEKHHIGLRKQYDKYSQCLDEIYKICDKELCKGKIKDYEMYCAMENIIHKVKEVKGE